jgi:plasmid stabilization system protein ParE
MLKLTDRFLLATISFAAPKASRTISTGSAIANDVRKTGSISATDREIGYDVLKLYSKGSMNQVMTHYHALNTYHQAVTCEYIGGRGAPRLLSIQKQKEHSDKFYAAKLAFEQAKITWLKDYADEIEKAKDRLGDYFVPADYPSPDVIGSSWAFTCQYMPIADPSAFQLGAFSEEQAKDLQKQLTAAVEKAAADATEGYCEKLRDAFKKAADQLRNGKRLHGSLLTNLQRLTNADLNVTEHAQLAAVLGEAEKVEKAIETALVSREDIDKNIAADKADSMHRKLAGIF